ncbi:F510_1955 family glycosylhydrolase [Alkalihalobacterium elongatum]|uniref:F510_1955 family glycosylhydrolase n=1 Tax=Alkalihalobacterium elongatum TaxID=2675466 RepID=UPI001C1F352E|nr:hypothetical protein [Alkalihalobacterium elongatum]
MKKYKKRLFVSVIVSGAILVAGCGQSEDPTEDPTAVETEEIIEEDEFDEPVIDEKEMIREKTEELSHIHGLEINPRNPESYLIATHHGIVEYEGPETAYYLGEMHDDFMGFSRVADTSYLMSSGHPVYSSDLPDPLGFMWSEDSGQSWEFRSLLGEYDFHALTASYQDDHHILGHALDFKNNFASFIFRSKDQGFNWDRIETNGLPLEHHAVHDLAFSPEDDSVIFAATVKGLYRSEDSGVNWTEISSGNVKGLAVLSNEMVYYFNETNEALSLWTGDKSETITYPSEHGSVNYIVVNEEGQLVITTERSSLLLQENDDRWNVLVDHGKVQ